MAGNTKVFVSFASADRPFARELAESLRRAGHEVWIDLESAADGTRERQLQILAGCDHVAVLLSPAALAAPPVRTAIECALSLNRRIVPVIVAACELPHDWRALRPVDLSGASARDLDRWALSAFPIALGMPAPSRAEPPRPQPPAAAGGPKRAPVAASAPRRSSSGLTAVLAAPVTVPLAMARGMVAWLKRRAAPPHDAAAASVAAAPPAQEAAPLYFGVIAPERAVPGSEFAVSVTAYIEAAKDEAAKLARALVGPGAREILDLEPDGGSVWLKGTPFTVRLSGRSFEPEPAVQTFVWSGRKNVIGFAVQLAPDARASAVLTVTVLVQGLVVLSIPVQIQVSDGRDAQPIAAAPAQQVRPAPRSAFASYASKDAADVTGRLASLSRFAPGLDIFLDCLDLRPGEPYKAQLEAQIAERDVFWLFWSRRAAASPWVGWELETALAKKPPEAIVPMPLEDPALAPPPRQLEHQHFRDRFSIAGLAMAHIAQQRPAP